MTKITLRHPMWNDLTQYGTANVKSWTYEIFHLKRTEVTFDETNPEPLLGTEIPISEANYQQLQEGELVIDDFTIWLPRVSEGLG